MLDLRRPSEGSYRILVAFLSQLPILHTVAGFHLYTSALKLNQRTSVPPNRIKQSAFPGKFQRRPTHSAPLAKYPRLCHVVPISHPFIFTGCFPPGISQPTSSLSNIILPTGEESDQGKSVTLGACQDPYGQISSVTRGMFQLRLFFFFFRRFSSLNRTFHTGVGGGCDQSIKHQSR